MPDATSVSSAVPNWTPGSRLLASSEQNQRLSGVWMASTRSEPSSAVAVMPNGPAPAISTLAVGAAARKPEQVMPATGLAPSGVTAVVPETASWPTVRRTAARASVLSAMYVMYVPSA